jgi:hypothetical protein
MTIARWTPPVAPTRQEQFLLKRLDRVRKLLGFLRVQRHELFNDAFQDELASMYRTTGAGKDALPPAMMAMAMLVQGYLGISDAEMVELTVVDLRVQMVLGCLGAEAPAFSQGALQEFRERLIAADLDRRLLERTVDLAKRSQAFDYRKLPKTLRVAIDSSPLEGAGRVEDTFTCLAHAARRVVNQRERAGWTDERVCAGGHSLLMDSSIKRAPTRLERRDAKAEAIRGSRGQPARAAGMDRASTESGSHQAPAKESLETPCRSARRIWNLIRKAEWRAFATGSPPIAGSRSRTGRCVTAAKVRASGSMDSSVTLPPTSIAV